MNDIERYDFWHREQDVFMRKVKEDAAIKSWNDKTRSVIDKAISQMTEVDMNRLFCEAIKKG